MYTDPISDYLTRIRNASSAKHKVVEIPASNLKKSMTQILFEQGYILSYDFIEDENHTQGVIKIALKYNNKGEPVIKEIVRVSTPGVRRYVDVKTMPRVLNGLGIALVSTSKGVLTNKSAVKQNVGGEVLCYIH